MITNMIPKSAKASLSLLGAASLSACVVATGPLFTQFEPMAEGTAEIYIYRVSRFFEAAMHYKVTGLPMPKADQKAYDMPNGSWRRIVVPPGTYSVKTNDAVGAGSCGNFDVSLKPGSTVFVEMEGRRIGTTAYGQFATGCTVAFKTREQALKELPALSRID